MSAWAEWVAALAAAEGIALGPGFPAEPDAAVRHLAQQAVCWMGWGIGHSDPADPWFHRQNDRVTQWGGPNADNVYRHARIDDQSTYRIAGDMGCCEDFLLALRMGNLHQERRGTLHEVSAAELGFTGPFSLVVGPSDPATGEPFVPMPAGARVAAVREYYLDWRPLPPAVFTIARLSGPPAASVAPSVGDALAEATSQYERALPFWNDYLNGHRESLGANAFGEIRKEPRGVQSLAYAFCFPVLGPDDALVVEVDVPDARYWSFQLYQLGWYEALDLGRTTSRNHRQLTVDDDGKIRVVVSHRDPGVPNWLDTEGRPETQLTFRCGWMASEPPQPTARLARLPDLAAGAVDTSARAAEVAARQAHLRWRWRT